MLLVISQRFVQRAERMNSAGRPNSFAMKPAHLCADVMHSGMPTYISNDHADLPGPHWMAPDSALRPVGPTRRLRLQDERAPAREPKRSPGAPNSLSHAPKALEARSRTNGPCDDGARAVAQSDQRKM